jgi:hypothetical protein
VTNARKRPLSLAISTSICAFILATLAGCPPNEPPGPDDHGPGPGGADARPPVCNNDGTCGAGETPDNCASDCHCGDGTCQAGETSQSCAVDCHCGDGTCQAGETTQSCPADCHSGPVCGNHACETGENVSSCAQDCAASLTITNNWSYTVYGLYARICSGSTWTENLLGSPLYIGSNVSTTTIPPGCWVFWAANSDTIYRYTTDTNMVAGEHYTWSIH